MNIRILFLLIAFSLNTASADFSESQMDYHPLNSTPNEPFIIDVSGEWPTDCHPGEQRPVISEYTGDTALIEFEIIVEHVTCNDAATPYRVLVDMSDVVGSVEGDFSDIDVTMRFAGQEFKQSLFVPCTEVSCPDPKDRDIKPESGLYHSPNLDKQGLLLARQNQRLVTDVLSYDTSGSSEWLFGAGGIVEDAFFVDLLESKDGQCLDCPESADLPQMEVVGKISMLMDSEGMVQVKVNDGQFVTYEQLDFGYERLRTGAMTPGTVANLTGRWAFVEDFFPSPYYPEGADSNISWIPLVFDIEALSYPLYKFPENNSPVAAPQESPALPDYRLFLIKDKAGNQVARMKCYTRFDWIPQGGEECDVYNLDNEDTLYKVRFLSLERIEFGYLGPTIGVPHEKVRPIAVRID